jgi:hypothetical protein
MIRPTWSDNKVRELIAVKVLHASLLNVTVVAFKVLPFGSYAPMSAPGPPFKTILELVLWNGLQSCRRVIPDVINIINMPSVFPLSSGIEESHWGLDPVNRGSVLVQLFVCSLQTPSQTSSDILATAHQNILRQ